MSTKLEAMLDKVRDALVMGDLAALAGLAQQVQSMAEDLPQLDRHSAETLQAAANRNAVLLQAALRGLKAAKGRLEEISSGPTLTTYDSSGRKEVLDTKESAATRRI